MSESPLESPAPPKGAIAIIFFIVFLDLLGFGIIIPLLPFYVPDQQHNSLQVGLLFSIYSICQFIAAPILGALSDRFGRRIVLALSQIGSTLGYLLLGYVSLHDWRITTYGLILIYISRVIDGLSGGNISTAQAYISDVTTEKTRAKGMGALGAAFGIGFAIGPAVGGIIGHYNIAYPAFLAAILSLAAAVLTWMRLPESRVHKPVADEVWLHPGRFKSLLARPVLGQLLAIAFFSMTAFVMMEAMLTPFLSRVDTFGWGPRQVGWYFAFVGLVIAIVQGGLIGRLTKLVREWPLAVAGPLLVALGMLGYTFSAFYPMLILLFAAGAINAIGRSLQQPTLSALISYHTDRADQGAVFGIYHGLGSLARVFGPIIAGLAYQWHITAPFLIAASIVLALAGWTILLARRAPLRPISPEPVPTGA